MKYSKGDEVLVRMSVDDIDPNNEPKIKCRFNGITCIDEPLIWTQSKTIYSLAPEFNPGEIIEVSDDNEIWVQDKFICQDTSNKAHQFLGVFGWYRYAREIQPKEEIKPDKIMTIDGQKYKLTKVEE